MNGQLTVQTQISDEITAQAAAVLAAVGLTMADFVRIALTRVALEKTIPFDPLIPNETTLAAMQEADTEELETVTLDDLRALIRANHYADAAVQA